MKKYPKNLADITVLAEVIQHLYEQAEAHEEQAKDYRRRLENGDETGWLAECISTSEAKASAYTRLAEKLTK